MTKGSLYHHFSSKAALFEAVYRAELERQVDHFRQTYEDADGPAWDAFQKACFAYLDLIREPKARRIAVVEAPTVLGAAAFRAIEDEVAMPVMRASVAAAMAKGEISTCAIEPIVHLVFAGMCEAANQMDQAQTLEVTHSVWKEEISRMFAGLR